jgi:hypothetical protein
MSEDLKTIPIVDLFPTPVTVGMREVDSSAAAGGSDTSIGLRIISTRIAFR